jgi:hypothetical protein
MRRQFVVVSLLLLAGIAGASYAWPPALWSLIVVGPLVLGGLYDMLQTKRTIVRNFPLFGRGRYIMEALRPKIYQYFIESDTDGTPINRVFRSVVYQRAKKELDTVPFGTEFDVYRTGYEWMNHSMAARDPHDVNQDLRVRVGGPDCTKAYDASILNISAMSYGALSKNAVLSLNGGAKLGNFAHNTGEGSISPYHLELGGDLIWQIGNRLLWLPFAGRWVFARAFCRKGTAGNGPDDLDQIVPGSQAGSRWHLAGQQEHARNCCDPHRAASYRRDLATVAHRFFDADPDDGIHRRTAPLVRGQADWL